MRKKTEEFCLTEHPGKLSEKYEPPKLTNIGVVSHLVRGEGSGPGDGISENTELDPG